MPTKAKATKKTMRSSRKAKPKAKIKKGDKYECGICGYRIVVDEACGCAEEHVYVCCGKKMKKSSPKKAAKKKA